MMVDALLLFGALCFAFLPVAPIMVGLARRGVPVVLAAFVAVLWPFAVWSLFGGLH